jgi:hypothetical protein
VTNADDERGQKSVNFSLYYKADNKEFFDYSLYAHKQSFASFIFCLYVLNSALEEV